MRVLSEGSEAISKITNPVEQKAVAYEKDHRSPSEYPHAFRRNFPRKRAYANRSYRRGVQHYLTEQEQMILEGSEISDPPVRRKTVRKWGTLTLRDYVEYRREIRIRQTAWNYFKIPYDRTHHQESFSRFLTTLLANETVDSPAYARYFHELLHPWDAPKPAIYINEDRKRTWMAAFLADTSEWDQRLRTWIDHMRAPDKT